MVWLCWVAWGFGFGWVWLLGGLVVWFVVVGISCVCELFVSWRNTVVGLRFASVCGGFVFGLWVWRGLDWI